MLVAENPSGWSHDGGRRQMLLTYDTGMSTRGRNAGLRVHKLEEDIGDEPEG